jgi:pilus assembly protein FimV
MSPLSAFALGLGQMQVKSQRDEPLLAEIVIVSNDPAELEALQARLASPETFARIGLAPPNGVVSDLQFAVALDARGRPVIRVTTAAPVQQPLLTFLVEVDWGQGRLVREYSALIDTPQTAAAPVQPPIQEAVTGAQNTIVRSTEPAIVDMGPSNPLQSEAPVAVPLPPNAVAAATPPAAANPLEANAPVAVPLQPSEIPATEPVQAVAAAAPVAPAAPLPINEGETRVVRRGETLGRIAADLGSDYSLDQTIVALLRANPEAFIGGNANRLKAGAVLRIPDGTTIAGYSADEAALVMREQMAQWRGARRALPQPPAVVGAASVEADAGSAVPSIAAVGARRVNEARLQIVPATASVAGSAATRSGITAGGKGDMLREQELLQTKETLAARAAEVQELKARVAELEDLQAKQQQLIALKDSELAAAQQRMAAANKAQAAASTATTTQQSAAPKHVESGGFGLWLGVGAGLLLLGLLAAFLIRRKRATEASVVRGSSSARLAAAVPGANDDGKDADAALAASGEQDRFESAFERSPEAASAPVSEPAWSRGAKPLVTAAASTVAPSPGGAAPTWHDPLIVSLDQAAAAAEASQINPTPPGLARIDLAKAYLDMGDRETARTLLREVAALGDRSSRDEAIRLLRDLV